MFHVGRERRLQQNVRHLASGIKIVEPESELSQSISAQIEASSSAVSASSCALLLLRLSALCHVHTIFRRDGHQT
eukprot:1454094-Rhodomonas_salina.4